MDKELVECSPEIDLYTACFLGDIKIVKDLLTRKKIKKCISTKNETGWTPLMYACFGCHTSEHKDVINYLVLQSANKKILNKKKQSAFLIAARQNDPDILEKVYVKDYIKSVDSEGNFPLYYSVEYGCTQSVKWLLEHNADPHYIDKESGNTLIMIAVKNKQLEIVKLLLKYNPNLELSNKNGETAVEIATQLGYYELAMLMEAHKGGNNMYKVLQNLSLEKYWPIMETNNIDLSKFLTLSEEDLKDIGITLLGPRRKLSVVISQMNARLMQSIGNYIENT